MSSRVTVRGRNVDAVSTGSEMRERERARALADGPVPGCVRARLGLLVNDGTRYRGWAPVPLRSMTFDRSIGVEVVEVVGCSGGRARQPL